jgi:hypothetical protein
MYYKKYELKLQNLEKNTPIAHKVWLNSQAPSKSRKVVL